MGNGSKVVTSIDKAKIAAETVPTIGTFGPSTGDPAMSVLNTALKAAPSVPVVSREALEPASPQLITALKTELVTKPAEEVQESSTPRSQFRKATDAARDLALKTQHTLAAEVTGAVTTLIAKFGFGFDAAAAKFSVAVMVVAAIAGLFDSGYLNFKKAA